MQKFLCSFLIAFITFTTGVAQTYSGGEGSENNPYLISSKEDMEMLAQAVNEGNTYAGKYFLLTQNLTGITTTIGKSPYNHFSGIFDGNGLILDVNIQISHEYCAVFGYLKNATIKNLGVIGEIVGDNYSIFAVTLGGICGYAINSEILHCYNIASINGATNGSAGGIVGIATSCNIKQCFNLGTIYGGPRTGGICGYMCNTNILNCYNKGEIVANAWNIVVYGGICGQADAGGSILNCYNQGRLYSRSVSKEVYAGSIVGNDPPKELANCFVANDTITCTGNDNEANRILGYLSDYEMITYPIVNCYALSSMIINDKYRSNDDSSSLDGKDASLDFFQSQTWITDNLYWDFDHVWEMSDIFSIHQGLPILQTPKPPIVYKIKTSTGAFGDIMLVGDFFFRLERDIFIMPKQSKTFTITPFSHMGYETDQVLIDGINNTEAVISGSYTFENVTQEHSIQVTFKLKQYIITASAGSGGSISPSGNISINHGESKVFTFTPNTGYEINQVLIDGTNNPEAATNGNYTFENITSEHTIEVTFKLKQYIITASAGNGGSISPSGNISINHGESKTFTFTPNTGYEINQVLIDGINNPTAVSNGNYTFENITSEHTIEVTFKLKQYTITASAGNGGSISPSGNISINHGESKTFTFTPNTGYEINQILIDGTNNPEAATNGNYTFENVTTGHTIQVTFKLKQYIITASAGSGGSISPSGNISINHGESKVFTFTPNTGYEINQVLIDGTNNPEAATNGNYTFENVTTGHTIQVTFKLKQYTITASAGSGGSISPSGNISINHGENKTFTFTPNTGYEINQVLIDGTNNPTAVSNGNYTFENVTTEHTIEATFKLKQYTITTLAGNGGNISPSGNSSINHGENKTFTFTPNTGYAINQVLIDGTNNPTAVSNGNYTFENITSEHTIEVTFKLKQYTITASVGNGGSISPSGNISINHGENKVFTFTPNTGYEINQVLIDGINNPTAVSNGNYTFENVTTEHTIEATFKLKQYTITASAGSGGSISPSGNISINHGENKVFTFTPNTGYEINQVLIDGINNPTAVSNGNYTFENVTTGHTIEATFKLKQYTIMASAGSGGSISPSGDISMNHGENKVFTFTPNTGYEINQVLIDGTNNPTAVSNGNYTFENVTTGHTIEVFFKENKVNIDVDLSLSSIQVDDATLSPVFDAKTTSYKLFFNCNQNTITLVLKPKDIEANITFDNEIDNEISKGTLTKNLTFDQPGTKTIKALIQKENDTQTYTFELIRPFDNVVLPIWDDVLSVINLPENNGGYTFTQYQWYRDLLLTEKIEGETNPNLYLPEKDNANPNYTVWLTTSEGISSCGCRQNLFVNQQLHVKAYPNPAIHEITIENPNWKPDSQIELKDLYGHTILKQVAAAPTSNISVSGLEQGIYLLNVDGSIIKIIKNK